MIFLPNFNPISDSLMALEMLRDDVFNTLYMSDDAKVYIGLKKIEFASINIGMFLQIASFRE